MAFDELNYLNTLPASQIGAPKRVYDRDNPPPSLSEAIRMAVLDIEAQDAAGIAYEWMRCERCTAGAVCRAKGMHDLSAWDEFGDRWFSILQILSDLTDPTNEGTLGEGVRQEYWISAGFGKFPQALEFSGLYYSGCPSDFPEFKKSMLAFADQLEAEAA